MTASGHGTKQITGLLLSLILLAACGNEAAQSSEQAAALYATQTALAHDLDVTITAVVNRQNDEGTATRSALWTSIAHQDATQTQDAIQIGTAHAYITQTAHVNDQTATQHMHHTQTIEAPTPTSEMGLIVTVTSTLEPGLGDLRTKPTSEEPTLLTATISPPTPTRTPATTSTAPPPTSTRTRTTVPTATATHIPTLTRTTTSRTATPTPIPPPPQSTTDDKTGLSTTINVLSVTVLLLVVISVLLPIGYVVRRMQREDTLSVKDSDEDNHD